MKFVKSFAQDSVLIIMKLGQRGRKFEVLYDPTNRALLT
jgi:hypothetical protein